MSDINFEDFDLGSMSNEAAYGFDPSSLEGVDLGGLEGIDLGGVDYNQLFDQQGLGDVLGGDVDYSQIFDQQGLSDVLGGDVDYNQIFDQQGLSDILGDLGGMKGAESSIGDFGSNVDLGSTEDIKTVDYLNEMFGGGGQNFGASTDVDKSQSDMADRGSKLSSQWQKTKDGRYIMVQDDGSGIGIDEDGNSFALSESQVQDRIKSGDLNTYASGYNTATGGNRTAPGGGLSLGEGKYLTTDGKVIYTDKAGNLTTTSPDKKNPLGGGGGGGGSDSSLNSLLPLLLMMMMMNQNKGGGSSGATIPGLTATQKQTPYAQQQKAAGYRPGQGGITYFDQTQYAPKMAAGGGISRLLQGPGDGVSDSIPAMIDGGMAGGGQPAKLARGEYVMDARTVAALGNGSTDAGAERLDKMRKSILSDDRKAGVGQDSKAYRHLMA